MQIDWSKVQFQIKLSFAQYSPSLFYNIRHNLAILGNTKQNLLKYFGLTELRKDLIRPASRFQLKNVWIIYLLNLRKYDSWNWSNGCFPLNFLIVELNCVINQQLCSLFTLNMLFDFLFGFSSRNVQYPRYQNTDFFQLCGLTFITVHYKNKS